MSTIRRAFVLATADRYIAIVINLISIAIVARLMLPSEIGIAVLGSAALSVLIAIRDFGADPYLVQQKNLTSDQIRATFTVGLLLTLVIVTILVAVTPTIADVYATAGLKAYLYVMALSLMLGPFAKTISGLLRREMKFGQLAIINLSISFLNAAASVCLALQGFSFMSFAWAHLISCTAGLLIAVYMRPDLSIFRLGLKEWRSYVRFAKYETALVVTYNFREAFPYLIFGRLLGPAAVGLYQRSYAIGNLPYRALFGGVSAAILPAFAKHASEGGSLKEGYLRGINYITVLQWPCLVMVILLAHPIVVILLGQNWLETVPLVRIIAGAMLLNFCTMMTYSPLVVAGAIRDALLVYLIVVPLSVAIITAAALFGLYMATLSLFLTVTLEVVVSVYMIRKHVPFELSELAGAMEKSAVVTMFSALGPLVLIGLSGFRLDLSIGAGVLGGVLAVAGWIAGLWISGHPFFDEIRRLADAALMARGESTASGGKSLRITRPNTKQETDHEYTSKAQYR